MNVLSAEGVSKVYQNKGKLQLGMSKYIHYQQDVVVLIEARTNYIYYLESAPLYNWLKSGE